MNMHNVNEIQMNINTLYHQLQQIPNPPVTPQQQAAAMDIQSKIQYYQNMLLQTQAMNQPRQPVMYQQPGYQPMQQHMQQPMMQTIGQPFNGYMAPQQHVTEMTETNRYSKKMKTVEPVITPQHVQEVKQQPQQPTIQLKPSDVHPLVTTPDRKEVIINENGISSREVELVEVNGSGIELKLNSDSSGVTLELNNPSLLFDKVKEFNNANVFKVKSKYILFDKLDAEIEQSDIDGFLNSLKINSSVDAMGYFKDVPLFYGILDKFHTKYFNFISTCLNYKEESIDSLSADIGDLITYINSIKLLKTKDMFINLLKAILEDVQSNVKIDVSKGKYTKFTVTVDDIVVTDRLTHLVLKENFKNNTTMAVRNDGFSELYQVLNEAVVPGAIQLLTTFDKTDVKHYLVGKDIYNNIVLQTF